MKVLLRIEGMSCSACSVGLEKYLNKQEHILSASVNLVLAQALIEYEEPLTLSDLERFVEEAGFKSLGVYDGKAIEKAKPKKGLLILFSVLAILTLYISMAHMIGLPSLLFLDMMDHPLNYAGALFLLACCFLWYGRDLLFSGIKNLIHLTPNMDTLVTLGVSASFLLSCFSLWMIISGQTQYVEHLYFESCAIIIFFVKLGRFIDQQSRARTKEAIEGLVQITPQKALLKDQGQEIEVTIDEVQKGATLIAKPGMKIAVDGIIQKGEAHCDEAFITGESTFVKKKKGDPVIAGSINQDGYIEYKAEKIGKDSTISEIVRLVIQAANTKPKIARIADTVSGYFVFTVIALGIVTCLVDLLIGWPIQSAVMTLVTIFVVACPCALGLATPLAIVISEGACAKKGILVRSSAILEEAHKIDTIVLDKTGTVTYGRLKISKVYNYSTYKEQTILKMVASLEQNSSHPVGKCFLDYVQEKHWRLPSCTDFQNLAGIGIEGTIDGKKVLVGNGKLFKKLHLKNEHLQDEEALSQLGNSIVYVVEEEQVIALIGVRDLVRSDAKEVILKLKNLGLDLLLLTGDHQNTADQVARDLGISKVIANVVPQEKTKVIQKLKQEGHRVMMVGDGINDAPSLAIADIGVSVHGGVDIAMDAADVILMEEHLDRIVALIEISHHTIRNIKQNLFWAFFYNALMIPIAMGALSFANIFINPMIASFAMMVSSLTVVFNALRLKRKEE